MHTLAILPLALAAIAPAPGQPAPDIAIDSALVIRPDTRSGRAAVFTDPVEHMLVRGTWQPPREGDTLGEGQQNTWVRIEAGENGALSHRALAGGYAFATVTIPEERIALLDARGHRHVYVNGEPRAGDVYNLGTLRLPIKLREGENEFLFRGGRGQLRAAITEPPAPVYIETRDMTLPDVIAGEEGGVLLAGIIIGNATEEWQTTLRIRAIIDERIVSETRLPLIGPLTVSKAPLEIGIPSGLTADELRVTLQLRTPDGTAPRDLVPPFRDFFPDTPGTPGELLHEETITLRIRQPHDTHKRTFKSNIDGSVQYYAVTPMNPPRPRPSPETPDAPHELHALFLTLHGASVEALGQASAYSPKDWGHIVAPTNRRPFGFDWEDWGRLDALEVLWHAAEKYHADPSRLYLTGHSMGGHGTWQLGVHYPGIFAAIAPSAGWPDFWSYTGAPEWPEGSPVERMLHRAANASRTRELVRNLDHSAAPGKRSGGVYILHGDADDNVPISQARMMRGLLGEFHSNFAYYEQPGAGHWWGNQCVDWPPLFEFLRQNTRADDSEVRQVDFRTINPAISSRSAWVIIEQQERPLEITRVQATVDTKARRMSVTTSNAAQVAFDLRPFADTGAEAISAGDTITIEIDGETLEAVVSAAPIRLARTPRTEGESSPVWSLAGELNTAHKHPGRAGPFKEAFGNNMTFVIGTKGTMEEYIWSYNKARFDAETFLYRGNATPLIVHDLLLDLDVIGIFRNPGDAPVAPGANLILYGNENTNAAFTLLAPGSPITIRRDGITIGNRTIEGDDLACLFICPRDETETASIGIVGVTGAPGMHLTTHLPYFISGAGFPDWMVIGAEMLEEYTGGVRGAGYFANDWSLGDDAGWKDD